MDKDYFIKLTFALYRVAGLFPKGESLKAEIEDSANKILADLILISVLPTNPSGRLRDTCIIQTAKEIESLENYFDRAQAKNWLKPLNFLLLKREYSKISKYLEGLKKTEEPSQEKIIPEVRQKIDIFPRQKRILETFNQKTELQLGDFLRIFPEINRRTLIRDLEFLFRVGLIKKNGERRAAYYIKSDKLSDKQ